MQCPYPPEKTWEQWERGNTLHKVLIIKGLNRSHKSTELFPRKSCGNKLPALCWCSVGNCGRCWTVGAYRRTPKLRESGMTEKPRLGGLFVPAGWMNMAGGLPCFRQKLGSGTFPLCCFGWV